MAEVGAERLIFFQTLRNVVAVIYKWQGIWKADKQLEEVTWRQVERGLGMPLRRFAQDSAAVPDQDLAVRVALEELQEIWQRRIVVRNVQCMLWCHTNWTIWKQAPHAAGSCRADKIRLCVAA